MQRLNVHVPNRMLYQAKGIMHIAGETREDSFVIGPETASEYPFRPLNTRRRKTIAGRIDPSLASDDVQKSQECRLRYTLNNNEMTLTLITKRVKGDGSCFFRTLSYLLTGTEKYTHLIRQKICESIANSTKEDTIRKYILPRSGQVYVAESKMLDPITWATDVEIIAATQLLQCDIFVYTTFQLEDGSYKTDWQRFAFQTGRKGPQRVIDGLYMENSTQLHYNPVLGFK